MKNTSQKCRLVVMSCDRADLDARRVHRHDDLADPLVGRPVAGGAADQVAVVGDGRETRPDLLAVDHPLAAVAPRCRAQRLPGRCRLPVRTSRSTTWSRREDAGQELGPLILTPEGDQRRAHLPVGEPHRRDRRSGGDQLLADDQPVDRRTAATAVLGRPGQPDPSAGGELGGDVLGVAVDPRVVVPPEPRDGVGRELPRFFAQRLLLSGPGEVHGARLRRFQHP